jgi:hypothetical protein
MQAVVATAAVASQVLVLVVARNATAVVKLGTLLAHAPTALPTTLGMAAAAEATVLLVAVVEVRLGAHLLTARLDSCLTVIFQLHVWRCRPLVARLRSRV